MAKNNRGRKRNHNRAKKKRFQVESKPGAPSDDGSNSSHGEDLEQPKGENTVEDVARNTPQATEETVEDIARYVQQTGEKTVEDVAENTQRTSEETVRDLAENTQRIGVETGGNIPENTPQIIEETVVSGQEYTPGTPVFLTDLPEKFNVGGVPLYSRHYMPFSRCDVCSSYSVKARVSDCSHRFCSSCSRLSNVGHGVFCVFCKKQMSYSLLEVTESYLGDIIMQCRCGLEGTLVELKAHINSREKACLDSSFSVKHLVSDLPNAAKTNKWKECSRYLLPAATFEREEVRPPLSFDAFLETVPRNPKLPHVFMDFEADGLYLGRLHIELCEDIVPKTVAKFLDAMNEPTGFRGANVDFILPNTLFQVKVNHGSNVREFFSDENFDLNHDQVGTLSMTNYGDDTNHCGFYVAAKPLPWRDGFNVVFGYVILGNNIIDRICELGREDGSSKRRVRIQDCGLIVEWMMPFGDEMPFD